MRAHHQTIQQQFDPQAEAYLASPVHASGQDLDWVQAWLREADRTGHNALDVGCGAGHLSFALAQAFAHVQLADPSPRMIETALHEAQRRSLTNVRGELAQAEQLPFGDRSFDLVATRFSAHHWRDLPAALRELRRVVKPDGRVLVIDLLGDESPLIDTHLQTLELLRDPSHVRDYTGSAWRTLLDESNFAVTQTQTWPLRLEFASWTARMRTAPLAIDALQWLLAQAPREVHDGLAIEADGSFTPRVGLFLASAR